jgi:hypothetical protein
VPPPSPALEPIQSLEGPELLKRLSAPAIPRERERAWARRPLVETPRQEARERRDALRPEAVREPQPAAAQARRQPVWQRPEAAPPPPEKARR